VRSIRVHRVAEGGYRPIVVSSTDFQDVDLSATWSIERAENYCPNIRLLLSELADYLWIPSERISGTIFVSPGPEGLPWHFDPAEVLIVPLLGQKVWFLKRNNVVRFPSHKYVPSLATEPNLELAKQCRGPLQAPDAHDCTWVSKPGKICFLPRGWWHRTEAKAPSVSLSIGLNTPRLMDVLLARLQPVLGRSEKWREPVSASSLRSA